MSVAIERLIHHFVTEKNQGAVSLEPSNALRDIDSGMTDKLAMLDQYAQNLLHDKPVVIRTPTVVPEQPQFSSDQNLQTWPHQINSSLTSRSTQEELAMRTTPLSQWPTDLPSRISTSSDSSEGESSIFYNNRSTLGFRRIDSGGSAKKRKRTPLPISQATIRTGNTRGTQTSRSFQGLLTPEQVVVDGVFLWFHPPYNHPPMELPAHAEFRNVFGKVWFELVLSLPNDFFPRLAASIYWPASNALVYINSKLIFCSTAVPLLRRSEGMNLETEFTFGPYLQAASSAAWYPMKLIGTVAFPDSGIQLALESTPFVLTFENGRVIIANCALRIEARPDGTPWHFMVISGLCRIGGLPSLTVWSPLPPDNGVVCFKTVSQSFWEIEMLQDLADFAGGNTDWFARIRRLDDLFGALERRFAFGVSVTADLPTRKITDIGFSVYGRRFTFPERPYMNIADVTLTWHIIHPFENASRAWSEDLSARVTMFGVPFDSHFRSSDLMLEGALPPAPNQGEGGEDEEDDASPGRQACAQAIGNILDGADSRGLEVFEVIFGSDRDAPFVDVLLYFDPYTDRMRITGVTEAGVEHAWEFR